MTMTIPGTVLLRCVTGSHAYGMNHADSDVDIKGVFAANMEDLTSLSPPDETVTHTDPDLEYHEVGKFIRLALKCNPTITEMLWLPDYQLMTDEGDSLTSFRSRFLSTGKVAGAYGGYAMAQINRLMTRNDGSFSSDTRKRYSKHARHCFRLLLQGTQLLTTGLLSVRVADPQRLFAIGELAPEELTREFVREYDLFQKAEAESVLPDQPDHDGADRLLRAIRRRFP